MARAITGYVGDVGDIFLQAGRAYRQLGRKPAWAEIFELAAPDRDGAETGSVRCPELFPRCLAYKFRRVSGPILKSNPGVFIIQALPDLLPTSGSLKSFSSERLHDKVS